MRERWRSDPNPQGRELEGIGGNWRELEGIRGNWRELEGIGGNWRELEGMGGNWRSDPNPPESEPEFGKVRKMRE